MSVNYETVPSLNVISRDEARKNGLKRYYIGVPCKNGHVAERYVNNNYCRGCMDDYIRKNLEEKRARGRTYIKNNKPKGRSHSLAWRNRNIEKARTDTKQWRLKKKSNKYISLMDSGSDVLSARGALMGLEEAIDIFKAQDNAFEYQEHIGELDTHK